MEWRPVGAPPDIQQTDEIDLYLRYADGTIRDGSYDQEIGFFVWNFSGEEEPVEWSYLWEMPPPITPPPDGKETQWF
jgi:hypothetical protein